MMRAPPFLLSFIVILMLVSPASQADDNEAVKTWVQNALLSTLTISYKDSPEQSKQAQQYYLRNAWGVLGSFLSDKISLVQEKKLELHPFPQAPPEIVRSGSTSGIHYWRVAQNFIIPELDLEIAFIVTVLETQPIDGSRFVIQSVSMNKKDLNGGP